MAEWFKAAVLKTVEPQGSGGSNPSSSARLLARDPLPMETPTDRPLRVLIVEDDPGNALLMKKLLVRLGGMSVDVTEDGDLVVALSARGDLDAIVMDVSLARTYVGGEPVDGLELTRRVRQGQTGESARPGVLLATAHAMQGDPARLVSESGADGYVSKPILDTTHFVDEVRRVALAGRGA